MQPASLFRRSLLSVAPQGSSGPDSARDVAWTSQVVSQVELDVASDRLENIQTSRETQRKKHRERIERKRVYAQEVQVEGTT